MTVDTSRRCSGQICQKAGNGRCVGNLDDDGDDKLPGGRRQAQRAEDDECPAVIVDVCCSRGQARCCRHHRYLTHGAGRPGRPHRLGLRRVRAPTSTGSAPASSADSAAGAATGRAASFRPAFQTSTPTATRPYPSPFRRNGEPANVRAVWKKKTGRSGVAGHSATESDAAPARPCRPPWPKPTAGCPAEALSFSREDDKILSEYGLCVILLGWFQLFMPMLLIVIAFAYSLSAAVLRKLPHSNCCKTVLNRLLWCVSQKWDMRVFRRTYTSHCTGAGGVGYEKILDWPPWKEPLPTRS